VRASSDPPPTTSLEAVRRELRLELPGQTSQGQLGERHMVFLRGTVKDLTSSETRGPDRLFGRKSRQPAQRQMCPSGDPQILLKVRFASVDRNKLKQLGINFFSTGFGNTLGGISTGQFSPPNHYKRDQRVGSDGDFEQ
jgi:pilus assembly protein CpaC